MCTETPQMETLEVLGCNEAINNTRTLTSGTNHQQVMYKHISVATDVEDSDPSKESLNDRYDRTETKFPPTDDEQQSMTLFGSSKLSKKLRTERELSYHERTRSRARHATPERP
jgi:hypothetical protein